MVANTWMDGADDEQLCTRTNWDGTGAAQIDYIMISAAIKVKNIWVEEHPWFKSDHRALVCEWTTGVKLELPQCHRRSKCICG